MGLSPVSSDQNRIDALERRTGARADEPTLIREYGEEGDPLIEVLTIRGGLLIQREYVPDRPAAGERQ